MADRKPIVVISGQVQEIPAVDTLVIPSAAVSDLTTGCMVSTITGGRLQTLDAAGSRALLELPPQNRSLKSGYGTGWVKFCTLKVTTQNHSAMATVDVVTTGRNLQSDRSVCRVFARIRQTSAMSSALNIVDVRYIQQGGISPSSYAPSFGYVITQDDATAKIVDVYLATVGSNDRFRYSVVGTWSDLAANAPVFYENSTVEGTIPAGFVAGIREDLVVESLRSNAVTAELPAYADANKTFQTESASAFRTRIGVAGAERINRSLKSATASGWLKLATLKATAVSHVASFMAEVVSVGRSTGATDTQRVRLLVRLKQNNAMSSPLDIIQCEYTSEGGSSFTLGYVVEQDDAVEKRVSIYVGANSSTNYVRFTVLSAYSNAAGNAPVFFEDPTPLASQPTPWVNASLAPLSGGAGTLTTLSTTGLATLAQATVSDLTTGRMVSTTTGGRLQTLDAAGSRALIGAYGSGDNASLGTLTVTGATTLSVALTGLLRATSGVVSVATAGDVTGQLLTGYIPAANTALSETDSILIAFGKVQSQINAKQNSLGYTALNKAGDTGINSSSAFQWTGADPRTWIQGGRISVYWGGVSHALTTRANSSSITIMRGGSITDDSDGGLDFLVGKLSVTTPSAATAYDLDIVNGVLKIANVGVVGSRKTGWAAATGTSTRTTFATSTVTTAQLAERVKALIDDLISHGLIGA